jgi:O-methyltransferase
MTETAQDLYLGLLKSCLTRLVFSETGGFDPEARRDGRDWPAEGETMIGLVRLDNLEECVHRVLADGVAGDLVEAGVWRGGAAIFMRALLEVYGDDNRLVWIADSFVGLPPPDPTGYPADESDSHWQFSVLAVSEDEVRTNFARYGLLDERVRFLAGWFRDTLPNAPIGPIAVLRIDADMYESTIVTLRSLYDRVTPGGFVIVDDYGSTPNCRVAVDDFRREAAITEPLVFVDWTGVCWRKAPAEIAPRTDEPAELKASSPQ